MRKRYTFAWDFHSQTGDGKEGEIQELDEEIAAHINRESPGVLEEVAEKKAKSEPEAEPEAESETRAVEEPPKDRMVRKPVAKRGA